MSMLCLKLSLVSPVFFTERVQFVLGDLEAVGRTSAWVSPDNRRAERGIKTDRAVAPKSVYTFVPPNRADLLGALEKKGGGINLVHEMPAEDLKKLHKVVFGTLSASGLSRKEDYIAKFRALFHDGDCSKQFLGGRGGVATAGMVCVFTPAGVVVAWKVLPTAESPNNVVDFMRWMRWMKVKPYLLSYDAACKLVKGLEKYCPALLEDKTGVLQRDGEGNVVFPELAHVGNNRNSATRETAARTFQDLQRTTDREDMNAVIETAGPWPGLQSEVDPDEALLWAANFSKVVGGRSKLTATRALDALHRDGVCELSLFEVLVFTYYWHRKAAGDTAGGAAGGAVGGAAGGAAGEAAGWVARAPLEGDEGGGFTHADAAGFLLRVLVGLSGSRQASKVSALPSWLHATCIPEGELATGLRRYAKAKVDFIVDCLKALTAEAKEREQVRRCGDVGGEGASGREVFICCPAPLTFVQ
ncbi:unnamed protein product [Ectocarpus sp. CCAP 1310/34]|nr:unnamed protein product [Ectocarpus sp. CCAP 1310/34]